MRVEIVGVNRFDAAPDNFNITLLNSILPWLQDTTQQKVWDRWGITYRDVMILDAFNRPIAPNYNLTVHDLGVATNYATLRKTLLSIATPADSDKDGLPDDWEMYWFGSLAPTPDGDDDHDGFDNRTELAFGSNPSDPASRPVAYALRPRVAGQPILAATFHRFSGGTVNFVVETSPDLVAWSADPTQILRVGNVRNSFDGTGGADVRFQLTPKAAANPAGFIRIRPVVKVLGK